jgi:penicillin-binding protein 1A
MENLTGGILPAQTWHDIMIYAHQGLDMKPPYGVAPGPAKPAEIAAAPASGAEATAPRPIIGLSPRAARVITEIGELARVDKNRRADLALPISVADQTRAGAAGAAPQ